MAALKNSMSFDVGMILAEQHGGLDGRPAEFDLLGLQWDLLPEVFAPIYTASTALFSEWLPYPAGGSFLEVGCGVGVAAVLAALRGCERVVAVDINPEAVRNTEMNATRHGVGDRVRVVESDVFDSLDPQERFDVIFWNSNVVAAPESFTYANRVQRAIFDRGYAAHRRYLNQGPHRLTEQGRMFLGFNSLGDRPLLQASVAEAGLRLVGREHRTAQEGRVDVTFELLELIDDDRGRPMRVDAVSASEAPEVPRVDREAYGDQLFAHGHGGERARLLALAAAFDPVSRTHLSALGVGPGWRCLDVGTGPGTLSGWLAEQAGPSGQVFAVDRDIQSILDYPTVTVVQADVTSDDFDPNVLAPGGFDLVHARFLLMHLRGRDPLLTRMSSWVRPGGWVVVSDCADLGTATSTNDAYRRTMAALWQALAGTIGTDVNYGRHYPAALADRGLTHVGAAVDLPVVTADSSIAEFWLRTVEFSRGPLLATGLVDDTTIDEALRYLRHPHLWELSIAMITAWGQRPPG